MKKMNAKDFAKHVIDRFQAEPKKLLFPQEQLATHHLENRAFADAFVKLCEEHGFVGQMTAINKKASPIMQTMICYAITPKLDPAEAAMALHTWMIQDNFAKCISFGMALLDQAYQQSQTQGEIDKKFPLEAPEAPTQQVN